MKVAHDAYDITHRYVMFFAAVFLTIISLKQLWYQFKEYNVGIPHVFQSFSEPRSQGTSESGSAINFTGHEREWDRT